MLELNEDNKKYFLERLKYVSDYVGDLTSNWLTVKSHLLRICGPSYRSFFSRRHRTTKKHTLNEFEIYLISEWQKITGVDLYLPIDKRHDPNWVHKKTGWFMSENHAELYRGKRRKEPKAKKVSASD